MYKKKVYEIKDVQKYDLKKKILKQMLVKKDQKRK